MPRITHRSAKNKGARFQKQIAAKISELLDMPYGKDECIASRPMGCSSVDIILVGPARALFPWSCEAKAHERFSVKSWIRQAKTNILDGTNWLLLFKKNRFKPVVCMSSPVFDVLFGDSGLDEYRYLTPRWKIEEYIEGARTKSKDDWAIRLVAEDDNVSMMDMDTFFRILSADQYTIKGVQG